MLQYVNYLQNYNSCKKVRVRQNTITFSNNMYKEMK